MQYGTLITLFALLVLALADHHMNDTMMHNSTMMNKSMNHTNNMTNEHKGAGQGKTVTAYVAKPPATTVCKVIAR